MVAELNGRTAQVPAAQIRPGAQSPSPEQLPEAEDQQSMPRHTPVPGHSASSAHGSTQNPATQRATPAHLPSEAQSGAEYVLVSGVHAVASAAMAIQRFQSPMVNRRLPSRSVNIPNPMLAW